MIIDINSEQDRLKVWEKAQIVDGYDSTIFRKDCCGAWMAYAKYGDTSNPYGWEIDHVYPKSMGGDNNLENLRAMNWLNNLTTTHHIRVLSRQMRTEIFGMRKFLL